MKKSKKHKQYEVYATGGQGNGGKPVAVYDDLETAVRVVLRDSGPGLSMGIKLPNGKWYRW